MTRDRAADPSRVNPCKVCARDVLPTSLGVAEHRAYHLEYERAYGPRTARREYDNMTALRDAWRGYASELEQLAASLRGLIGERDDVIANLEEDRWRLEQEIADLKAQVP